jgi:peptidoglycan/LPS O-acetylase OafA/YrhL
MIGEEIGTGNMNFVSPKRNYAIDWLRVYAMFTVFLFHCARFFDRQDWHVKNPQSDTIITFIIVLFLVRWQFSYQKDSPNLAAPIIFL